jgi:hypothetical protein
MSLARRELSSDESDADSIIASVDSSHSECVGGGKRSEAEAMRCSRSRSSDSSWLSLVERLRVSPTPAFLTWPCEVRLADV